MTVIEAMSTAIDSTGVSYFDKYADESFKRKVYSYISTESGVSDLNAWGSIDSLGAKETNSLDFNGDMTIGTQYYLIAAAKHTKKLDNITGDSYGFKAVSSVHKVDTTAPSLTTGENPIAASIDRSKIYTAGTTTQDVDWDKHPESCEYYGEVTITFDRELYQVNGETRKMVVMAESGDSGFDDDTMVSALELIGGTSGKFKLGVATTTTTDGGSTSKFAATRTFTFKFEKLTIGDMLVFPTGGNISSATSNANASTLTLLFDPTLKGEDYEKNYGTMLLPGFHVSISN
jgi:hypothetical protein